MFYLNKEEEAREYINYIRSRARQSTLCRGLMKEIQPDILLW